MTMVTVDIIDEKGLNLLKDLEALNIIRLHSDYSDDGIEAVLSVKSLKGKMAKQPMER